MSALDFTNSYGVHPFWPVDNRWYYGDAVFIVEPLLWACSAPLLFTLRSKVTRALVAVVLVVGIGLSWASGLVPVLVRGPADAADPRPGRRRPQLVRSHRAVQRHRRLAGGDHGVFVATGRIAEARLDALLADRFPGGAHPRHGPDASAGQPRVPRGA